nr:MAG TPA: hypothetical protein [Caudoviricetes sp.]
MQTPCFLKAGRFCFERQNNDADMSKYSRRIFGSIMSFWAL